LETPPALSRKYFLDHGRSGNDALRTAKHTGVEQPAPAGETVDYYADRIRHACDGHSHYTTVGFLTLESDCRSGCRGQVVPCYVGPDFL
jgi:hypothetical protein